MFVIRERLYVHPVLYIPPINIVVLDEYTLSTLVMICLDVVARCTIQSVYSNILMPSSVSPSPSVNLETVLIPSFGLGPGLDSSASSGFQGNFAT